MKIMIVNPAFDDGGGITTYASELITCLSQEHELCIVLPDDSMRPVKNSGVKVIYHDPMELSSRNARLFIKLINEDVKPDVVISSFGLIIPVIAPYINDDTRVITVSHSGKYFNSDYCALNHRYTDHIIAASSDYNKNYLEKKFHIRDKSKIRVIYNSLASDPETETLRFIKQKSDVITIVFAGGSVPGKNSELVLKILCRMLKTDLNFKFIWAGGSELPLPKRIKNRCRLNNVKQYLQEDERVVFTGRIPAAEDFVRLVSSANVLLAPSRNEGCSMLLLQSLRSGSICMVGDYPHSSREIVENGECGFVLNHRKPEDFVGKLSDIITRPSDYARLYENAHNVFLQKLSYPVWSASLNAVMGLQANHAPRKNRVSKTGLAIGVLKMKGLKMSSYCKRMLFFTLGSLASFYVQFIKLKLRKDFPLQTARSDINRNQF